MWLTIEMIIYIRWIDFFAAYAPLKLMQAVTNEVNEICRRYLDNSRLALLPPPSSTPQVTVGAMRNSRRKMEDRHMILHDLNTMFNIQVKIPLAIRNHSVNDLIYNTEITINLRQNLLAIIFS